MAFRRSLDFLPSFFRTETNSKFLNATLDQLISEPELKRLDGYIGRKFAPSYRENDGYIDELSPLRQNYQLEPSTIYKDASGKTQLVSTYQDLLNRIEGLGGIVTDQSRLFASKQYTYSGLFDFDKFSNYASYYWLPNGPDTVDVSNVDIPYEQELKVTPPKIYQTIVGEFQRENFDTTGFDSSVNPIARVRNDGYKIDAYGDKINPTIRLARGGTYTFKLDQFGHGFFIQTAPGLNIGTSWQQNLSIRDVYGVENNGTDIGSLTFAVPNKDAQDYFINMPLSGTANLVARSNARNRLLRYVDVQYASYDELVSVHGGLDGQRFINGKTVVFLKDPALTSVPVDWQSFTDYLEGDIIRYGVNVYRALNDFTSGRLFSTTNLELYDDSNDWYDPIPFDGNEFPFDSTNYDRGPTVAIDDRTAKFLVSIEDGLVKLTPSDRSDLNTKIKIGEGIGYGNRQVYHTAERYLEAVPNITANLDYLYYQDSMDPNINGIIEIVDQYEGGAIDVTESILGKPAYASPNNVEFTNGLKIKFRNNVVPEIYAEKEFYVEGVGDAIQLIPVEELTTPDTWLDVIETPYDSLSFDSNGFDTATNSPINKDYLTINRASPDRNAWSRNNRWFHQEVIEATARYNNYEPIFDFDAKAKRPIIEFYPGLQLFNYGKIAKKPVDIIDFNTTDAFSEVEGKAVQFDGNIVNTYYSDAVPLLEGTRIIFASDTDNNVKNKIYKVSWIRPKSQTDDKQAVFEGDGSTSSFDLNFNVPDPNRLTVTIDGVNANDAGYVWGLFGDQTIVFEVNPGLGLAAPAAESVIIVRQTYGLQLHLELDDGNIQQNDSILVLKGLKNQGSHYWFNNGEWIKSQAKSSSNQAPLFELVDTNGISLSNTEIYPSNNFFGNKIFGYKTQATGAVDPELGLRLKYRNFNNVGDIVFSDYLASSILSYRRGTQAINETTGGSRVIYNAPDGTTQYLNQWQVNEFPTQQYQTQTFFATAYQKNLFLLNVLPTDRVEPLSPESILVYVNNRSINNDKFNIQLEGGQGYLLLDQDLEIGDKLDVKIATNNHNTNSVYEVPSDLNYNPLNQEINDFTLGQLRDHITKVFENTPGLTGEFIGKNNSRDLGNIKKYGGKIVQNLGSTHLANLFLNDVQANFVESLLYSQREYTRYKNKFLELLYNMPLSDPRDPVKSVDEVINEISSNKSEMFPFFASDMIAFGNDYKKLSYRIVDPNVVTYDLTDLIDFTRPNERAVSVYLNGRLLIKDLEYTIPSDRPVVELILDSEQTYFNQSTLTLQSNDLLEIREYVNTDGSHIPPTPTKLGLYPAFIPVLMTDGRDNATRTVIRGHDGSLTALFGDHRDDCLLEFERRIYNNLKVRYTGETHDYRDYVPGAFNNTSYTKTEYDSIISGNFNSWLGKTGLRLDDYVSFDANDPWTWNYRSTTSKVDGKPMPAAYWRGIFQHYFGTDAPHLRPWEMLGFADEPVWWTFYYGFAPYTRGNTVLWEDLSRGYIADGERKGIDKRFARPNLVSYIPVDESGNMLSPFECLVKERNKNAIEGKFFFGDSGPVETAWRQSSEYPFAMQLALALMQPAEYFGGNIDKNRQVLEDFGINGKQWIYSDTRRRQSTDQYVHGEVSESGTVIRINSYTTWISEYAKSLGLDRSKSVGDKIRGSTVQLAYKVAGYTDKKFLKIYADQATPNSTNNSVMIPDDDFDIVLVKGAPTQSITYSGVIVTKSTNGFKVSGYDDNRPYFTIETSSTSGRRDVISVGSLNATKYLDSTNRLLQVPYGTEFLNADQVVDFLISYGRYLTRMGFQFNDKLDEDAGFYKDWDLAAREFLFYVQQGWEEDIAISLSPIDKRIRFQAAVGTVDGLTNRVAGTRLLTEDYQILRPEDYVVNREGRQFTLDITKEGSGIYLLDLDVVNYEHVLVFENTTQFADLIYDPSIGSRQFRLRVKGFKTGNWDGSFGAAGFIINEDNIEEWQQGKNYYKGDIVLFKNVYYTASENIAGSTEFDNGVWLKSDYNKVSKGLLPSLANKSGQFKSFYDINSVNLELDADRLGKGLIGLRPRSYFENLQISDTSQAKFYQGLITQKGSKNSLDKLLRAKLDNFDGSVNFYEDWALRSGQYGATGIRQQIQVEIDETKANRDPLLIELLGPNENSSEGRMSYRESDIWTKPRPFESNFLGTKLGSNLPGYLPSAGYAMLDDVSWTATSMSNLNNQINANLVGRGDTIYVASDLNNQWSIYRVNETEIKIKNLTIAANGVATFEFDKNHGLDEANVILIKTIGNNPAITAFYTVASLISNTKITVNTNYAQLPSTAIDAQLYKLANQRFTSISEVAAREPLLGWETQEKLFIDEATSDGWGVYEKRAEFKESNSYFAKDPLFAEIVPQASPNANFGQAVAVNFANTYMLVGQPGEGNVITYTRVGDSFQQDLILDSRTVGAERFGTRISASDNGRAVISAPNSDGNMGMVFVMAADLITQKFAIDQVIVPDTLDAGGNFGASIAISDDGDWLAVGQPDVDGGYVYLYQANEKKLQPLGLQEITYLEGLLTYTLTGDAAYPKDTDTVTVRTAEGIILKPYDDYFVEDSTITFTLPPTVADGTLFVEVEPTEPEQIFFTDGSTSTFELTGNSANPMSIYGLKIVLDSTLLVPFRDYDLTGNIITLYVSPPAGAQIRVTQRLHFELVSIFTSSDNGTGDRFGASVDITSDGRRIVVGAPGGDGLATDSGKVYVYERTAIEFVADGEETTFAASVQTPTCKVFVNDELAEFELGDDKGEYELDSGDVVFKIAPPQGALIRVENNYVVETAILSSPQEESDTNLGISVLMCPTNCSIYAGAPRTDGTDQKEDTGRVHRWVNQGRLYGSIVGTVDAPTANVTAYLIINDRWLEINSGSSLDDIIDIINNAEVPGVVADSLNNKLRIQSNSIIALDKLKITATDITLLDDLGLQVFKHVQSISNPENEEYGRFGEYLSITPDALTLVISSDRATSRVPMILDGGITNFDNDMTVFIDAKPQSGAVYTYQYISRPDDSIETPGQFIPAQKLFSNKMDSMDMFGASIVATSDRIYVGAPGDDTYATNGGIVVSYNLADSNKAWTLIRNEVPKVNINLINRVSLIDSKKNIIVADLDFIDPFKGKISGIAAQEIEYRVSYDPAVYNVDRNDQLVFANGVVWGREQVGKLWWNTSQVRWMEYEQGSLEYRTVNWGTAFPNSTIFCLEWTESTVPPDQYIDPNNRFAFVIPNSRYNRIEYIDDTGALQVRYYFWVGGKTSVPDVKNRKISAVDVESLIANPKAAGVSYAAFVGPNAISLFNCGQYFRDKDILLSIDYDVSENQDNIHAEYQLISEGDETSLPSDDVIVKLIDSIAGSDIEGRIVPDITLSPGRKYGKEFRPRQSMFRNRNAALKVATDYVNSIMTKYPVLLEKNVTNLLSSEPLPPATSNINIEEWSIENDYLRHDIVTYQGNYYTAKLDIAAGSEFDSTLWIKREYDSVITYNDKVANLTELGYVLIDVSPIGYKVAVESDESVDGRWTIYEVIQLPNNNKVWNLARVQSYVNERFIDRVDWVAEGESTLTNTDWVINFNYQLPELLKVATVGQTAKVRDDGRGLYSIYRLDANNEWQIIVREAATLKISESIYDNTTQQGYDLEGFDLKGFDEWQNLEIQRIFRAVYDDIFTVDLEIEKNNWFFIMMQHLLQEQQYVDWLFKSSFIKIEQRQRAIIQIPTYQRDNQDLVRQYIEEVKPYHTKIREYVLRYDGSEQVGASTSDFDVPAYYIAESNRYRSPNGSETIDSFILDLEPYTAWRDNHGFYIESIEVIDGGSGYSSSPSVTVVGGGAGSGARVFPVVADGSIKSMIVVDPGKGYTSTPELVFGPTSGSGARFAIRLANNTVRKISNTMKFDRIGTPNAGFLVQFRSAGETLSNFDDSTKIFPILNQTLTFAHTLEVIGSDGIRMQPYRDYDVDPVLNKIIFTNAPSIGEVITIKGKPVDIRNELISRRESEAGVVDYLLDILSQSIVNYNPETNGNWIVGDLATIGYPVPSVPNYRFFDDTSGRINVLYQTKPGGWNDYTLQAALRNLGTSVGANGLDISGTEVIFDGSMTSYAPNVFEWQPNTYYQIGDIITYNNNAYRVNENYVSGDYFTNPGLELLNGASFDNHLDRTWAYYQPRGGQFGRDLGQLFTGVEFPGVNVRGPSFSMEPGLDVAAFDNEPYDNFIIGPEGTKVIDPAIMDQVIRSDFTDTGLGVRPEDIIVYGNDFLHPYYSHAPEEMVPGRIYDTLNIKVFSTPSSNWFEDSVLGLPIALNSSNAMENPERIFSYIAPADRAATLLVFTAQTGRLIENEHFTADRVNKTVQITRTILDTDTVYIYAIDNGGPGMVYTNDFVGDGCTLSFNIPVDRNRINQFYVMIDGIKSVDWTLLPEEYTEGESTVFSTLVFDTPPDDGASVYVYGFYTNEPTKQAFTEIHNTAVTLTSASYPEDYIIDLDRIVGYDYPHADKVIVELNGNRLRPPNQMYHTGDGSTAIFSIPTSVPVDVDDIVEAAIKVSVNGVVKNIYEHWNFLEVDGSTISNQIQFTTTPLPGDKIVISFDKGAAYSMMGNNKIFINPSISLQVGDRFNILTFTNHDAIEMHTQVFEGSSTDTRVADIGFDDVGFDSVALDAPSIVLSTVTKYTLARPVTKDSYLWIDVDVEANGVSQHLSPGVDFVIDNNGNVEVTADVNITPNSIIIITSFAELAQKPSMAFRIFKDMNDNFEYYRMSRDNTTYLSQDLYLKDEWIYVEDASKLPAPGNETNTPGQVMVNGEMIRYFVRDLENNRLGQIRRAVNGTGAAMNIPAGTLIQDSSRNQIIPNAHGRVWYDPGVGTPSNGLGLQNSNTVQAKFLLAAATIPES